MNCIHSFVPTLLNNSRFFDYLSTLDKRIIGVAIFAIGFAAGMASLLLAGYKRPAPKKVSSVSKESTSTRKSPSVKPKQVSSTTKVSIQKKESLDKPDEEEPELEELADSVIIHSSKSTGKFQNVKPVVNLFYKTLAENPPSEQFMQDFMNQIEHHKVFTDFCVKLTKWNDKSDFKLTNKIFMLFCDSTKLSSAKFSLAGEFRKLKKIRQNEPAYLFAVSNSSKDQVEGISGKVRGLEQAFVLGKSENNTTVSKWIAGQIANGLISGRK